MKTGLAIAVLVLASSATLQSEPSTQAQAGKRCILPGQVAGPTVRDDGRLYFRGEPNSHESYIAVFKGGECRGLNRFSTVTIETSGVGYCDGDKVRSFNPPSTIPGPACVIDHFLPFDGEVDDPFED